MSKDDNRIIIPPPFIGGSEHKRMEIPNLLEEFMKSDASLLTLSELTDREIALLNRAFVYAERYELDFLVDYLNKLLLMKISRRRRGRLEFMQTLKMSPAYQKYMKYLDEVDIGKRPRV